MGEMAGTGIVLVVDDEAMVKDLARDILKRHGYAVLTAGGATAAAGGNRVVLGGNNSYSGGTVIRSGQLQLGSATGAGAGVFCSVSCIMKTSYYDTSVRLIFDALAPGRGRRPPADPTP